ncbi:MAG TPA: ester cyclase [Rhizomicrobium sp.]|jgi:predicted ester cyclase
MSETEQSFRRWYDEVWNKRRRSVAHEIADPKMVFYDIDADGNSLTGLDGFFAFSDQLLAAFPDLHFTVHDSIGIADSAAVRWTAQATHKGAWEGHAPTNKPVTLKGMGFARWKNGKVVESWNEWDRLGLMKQIQGS